MIEQTRPLTREGFAEVVREMNQPPADTPARRATAARAAQAADLVSRVLADQRAKRR